MSVKYSILRLLPGLRAISINSRCTYNGYYATFDEVERGSLEVGKIADMVVLSDNPYQMPTDSLNTLQVQQLLLGGKPYRPLKKGAIGHIVRGMLSK